MRIVVSDSRCLIDLGKVALLETCLCLPYEFLIPNTLFEEELLRFTAIQKTLVYSRLKIIDLPGERVLRAQAVVRKFPQISVQDGFAFALAESKPGCILLTGDDKLRNSTRLSRSLESTRVCSREQPIGTHMFRTAGDSAWMSTWVGGNANQCAGRG